MNLVSIDLNNKVIINYCFYNILYLISRITNYYVKLNQNLFTWIIKISNIFRFQVCSFFLN